MRLAISTPPEHTDLGALRDLWAAADELGFEAAFTLDHLVPVNPVPADAPLPGARFEGWMTLATLAGATRRLRVGTLTSGVSYRSPALLAKMAVTLDHATGGRAILGVGAGWHEEEHRMFGIPFPAAGARIGLLDETLEAFDLLCRSDGPVDYKGRHIELEGAVFQPKPVSPDGIPVLVGGSGPRLRAVAARRASIFNGHFAPAEWREVNDDLDRRLEATGRRPQDLVRSAFVPAELSRTPAREKALTEHEQQARRETGDRVRARVVLGDAGRAVAVLRSYEEAGVEMAVLNLRAPHGPSGLAWLADEVLREVAAA